MAVRAKRLRRWSLGLALSAAVLYAGWWALCEWVFYPSLGYHVEAEFAEAPPDDEALRAWLRRQPGAAVAHVTRAPSGPVTRVRVLLIMSRNLHGRPPLPDFDRGCAELGYRGQVAPFRDVP